MRFTLPGGARPRHFRLASGTDLPAAAIALPPVAPAADEGLDAAQGAQEESGGQ